MGFLVTDGTIESGAVGVAKFFSVRHRVKNGDISGTVWILLIDLKKHGSRSTDSMPWKFEGFETDKKFAVDINGVTGLGVDSLFPI
jgi:hypothetical protein